jgi:hypothetical protein
MTAAAKWVMKCRRGGPGDYYVGYEQSIITDLAAVEAEFASFKKDCTITHETDNNEMMAVTADRNDLRRKLEEAEDRAYSTLSAYGVPKDRARSVANGIGVLAQRFRRELVDASLANAALREALGQIEDHHNYTEEWRDIARAALALPADGLAEEVRKYMRHDATCDKSSNLSQYVPCTCGLDALLAKLGARP